MSKPNLDGRHRNKDGEISSKRGNTLARCAKSTGGVLLPVIPKPLLQLNETSLSQLRRDHETEHLEHKIAHVSE